MAIISHLIGVLVLYLSRSVVNIVGCPFGISVDSLETLSALDKTIEAARKLQRHYVVLESFSVVDIEREDEINHVKTPLLVATAKGNKEATDALLEQGALFDVIDDSDKTVLLIAAEENHGDILVSFKVFYCFDDEVFKLFEQPKYSGLI